MSTKELFDNMLDFYSYTDIPRLINDAEELLKNVLKIHHCQVSLAQSEGLESKY